jgi:hypothetical protein
LTAVLAAAESLVRKSKALPVPKRNKDFKERSEFLKKNAESVSSSMGPLQNLQVFICSEEDGSPFVELTFFPDDVESGPFLRRDFIAWARQMQTHLGARRYYARYENASWRLGDTGPQSGVFLVSDDITQNA